MESPTFFEQLGGEERLKAIIDAFIDSVVEDPMIGFLFRGVDRDRLKQMEFEFAAQHLGAPIRYTGRPIGQAHAPHRIMGGQFMRRLQLLRETLELFGVPEVVKEHWLTHTERLRAAVTKDKPGECTEAGPLQPASTKVDR